MAIHYDQTELLIWFEKYFCFCLESWTAYRHSVISRFCGQKGTIIQITNRGRWTNMLGLIFAFNTSIARFKFRNQYQYGLNVYGIGYWLNQTYHIIIDHLCEISATLEMTLQILRGLYHIGYIVIYTRRCSFLSTMKHEPKYGTWHVMGTAIWRIFKSSKQEHCRHKTLWFCFSRNIKCKVEFLDSNQALILKGTI